jgi:hypothetical protein
VREPAALLLPEREASRSTPLEHACHCPAQRDPALVARLGAVAGRVLAITPYGVTTQCCGGRRNNSCPAWCRFAGLLRRAGAGA